MTIVIRDSTPEDFEELWRIDQECFPPGISYSRPELKSYMRRRKAFTLVAHNSETRPVAEGQSQPESEITGFLVAEGGPRGVGHIITIDVVAMARKLGVGSALLRAAEKRLGELNCSKVGLETAVDNRAALSFYKYHNYSVAGTWPRYYSNGVDALMLIKDLH